MSVVRAIFDQIEPDFVRRSMVISLRRYGADRSTAVDVLSTCGYPPAHIVRHLDDVCAEVFGVKDEQ